MNDRTIMSDFSAKLTMPATRPLWPSWPRLAKRPALLDVGSLPDHLKRDMGILDGNDPAGRRR